MITGRDRQPEPSFKCPLHRRRNEARSNAKLLTRLIRDQLAALRTNPQAAAGRQRVWIIKAQARRREWLAIARHCGILIRERQMLRSLLQPLAAE